ncbi:MAG: hypothetical protein Barrevirus4_10 [Barrevirus sp.]|uniref:Uncharacterized protein n=1 Tax=Barrevirus sp. TaxID=2487763 RepID=A0A3G4ZPW2_9VIRU|nr:MAG: hypothetical protein Barrevirus4_10 [Barrevirus sp.]
MSFFPNFTGLPQQQPYTGRVYRPGYPQPVSLGMARLIDASRPTLCQNQRYGPIGSPGIGPGLPMHCQGSTCPNMTAGRISNNNGSNSSSTPSFKSNSVARASGI